MENINTAKLPDSEPKSFDINNPMSIAHITAMKHREHALRKKRLFLTVATLAILATAVPAVLNMAGHEILSATIGGIATSWLIISLIPGANPDIKRSVKYELAPAEPMTLQRIIDWSAQINAGVSKYRDAIQRQQRQITNTELRSIEQWIHDQPYTLILLHGGNE